MDESKLRIKLLKKEEKQAIIDKILDIVGNELLTLDSGADMLEIGYHIGAHLIVTSSLTTAYFTNDVNKEKIFDDLCDSFRKDLEAAWDDFRKKAEVL